MSLDVLLRHVLVCHFTRSDLIKGGLAKFSSLALVGLITAFLIIFANNCPRRYLRARKFVPKEALTQFKATEDWRKENRLEEIYDTIDIKEYDETRRLVSIPMFNMDSSNCFESTHNGQDDETDEAYP